MEPAFSGVKSINSAVLRFTDAFDAATWPLDETLASVYIRVRMRATSDGRNPFFGYLRRLRAGGRTNMYGAIPYLMNAFGLNRETAFSIVCQWLDQQNAPTPPGRLPRGRKLSSTIS